MSNGTTLKSRLEEIRARFGLPGVSLLAVDSNRTMILSSGLRAAGTSALVGENDRWHIGSIGKPLNALLAARLVQENRIRWDTRLADIVPELRISRAHPLSDATLHNLLSFKSSLRDNFKRSKVWPTLWESKDSPSVQRVRLLTEACSSRHPVRQAGAYSNLSYLAAGTMLERAAGDEWESILERLVLAPLRMVDSGFGAPGTPGIIDQPRGHVLCKGKAEPIEAGPYADNPPAFGPAGRLHVSSSDLERFIRFIFDAVSERHNLLKVSEAQLIYGYSQKGRALGWTMLKQPILGDYILSCAGSNTMWFAVVRIAPLRQLAVAAMTNIGTSQAAAGLDQLVDFAIKWLTWTGTEA